MKPLDPHESLGFHCALTVKAFMSALESKIEGTHVSKAQFLALEHLIISGPLSQAELVECLSITPATGARLVDRMVRDGWVKRQADPRDGRVNQVVPTKRITRMWPELRRAGRELLDQAYRDIKPAKLETVKQVLKKIRKNLES